MAKQTETAIAKREVPQVPAYIKQDDQRGKENIQGSDVRFPALKLSQGTSPEMKRQNPKFIEGLREGELFNSVTREIYGEDPVRFVVVHYAGRRNVEFDPQDREKVIDGQVPDNDERCEFREVVENGVKVRKPPIATTFKDFVILATVEGREPQFMTLTFKKTQLKRATDILTQLGAARRLPAFALAFTADPIPDKRGNNDFYGWRIAPAGYATELEYKLAEQAYEKLQGKTLHVDDEDAEPETPGDGEKVPF